MNINLTFLKRELLASPAQSIVFILCVALSVMTVSGVSGFGDSVRRSLLQDGRALHGGDILIRSHFPLSQALVQRVEELEAEGKIAGVRSYEFYSVVRSESESTSVLADIKAVGLRYPLYGDIKLASGRSFRKTLKPGAVIVEQSLPDRLGVRIGDMVRLGRARLRIQDIVLREPDRPVNFLSFGPRVFVSEADIPRLDLLQKGSRVRYRMLLKLMKEANPQPVAEALRQIAVEDQERVEVFTEARSRVKRFFDNFFFYLSLNAVFIVLLSGIGIHGALTALVREKRRTVAILRAVGALGGFVMGHYLTVVACLGVLGACLGVGASYLLQKLLIALSGELLPEAFASFLSWRAVGEGLLVGFVGAALFSYIPLSRIRDVRPAAVFRNELKGFGRRNGYLPTFLILIFFAVVIIFHLEDVKTGLYFLGGVGALILAAALLTQTMLFLLKRFRFSSLMFRQAVRGLFRPGGAIRSVIISLTAALSVIFTLFVLEKNLDAAFVQSFPEDAPNLFFIDIQPDQAEGFEEAMGKDVTFYPVIRSRLVSVNGEKIDRNLERRRRRDNLARPFNLTYRNDLLEDEEILEGKNLFRENSERLQVSVLDTVTEMKPMNIGDRIVFRIQGVPVEAEVSSIRRRTEDSIRPFFYFVFPEDSILKDAPQTIFSALRVPPPQIGAVQNRIVSRFPNVSVINATQTIASFAGVMRRLSRMIRFIALFSIAAGMLIFVSSVFATRFSRIQETVYFKIVGARSRFILGVLTLENGIIGVVSAVLAFFIAHSVSALICRRGFDIAYLPFPVPSLLMTGGAVLLVILMGFPSSRAVLKQRPVVFLRDQTIE